TGGFPATAGPDTATGDGLVDAAKAVMLAKVKCLGPIIPIVPVLPIQPIQPVKPITVQPVQPVLPIQPVKPIQPVQPVQPVQPIKPIQPGPITPIQPIKPIAPVVNPGPVTTKPSSEEAGAAEAPEESARKGMSAEDVDALSEMVINSEIDLDL
ncbi:MAG TPA: hypothetical protein VEV81_11575, partial [Pyrinomonadaceae bacterium]|nr:hypothetical protein [Pyrinomonadaceae bacterium]